MIRKDKKRYSITMLSDTYTIIDFFAHEVDLTRSEVIEKLLYFSLLQSKEDLIKLLRSDINGFTN